MVFEIFIGRRSLLLSLMLFLSCATFIAQPQFKFDKYSLKDGIPEVEIRAITQDSLGFLWIGTANGLYRYDGHVFKLYTSDPSDSTSLSNVDVEEVFIDSAQCSWNLISQPCDVNHDIFKSCFFQVFDLPHYQWLPTDFK